MSLINIKNEMYINERETLRKNYLSFIILNEAVHAFEKQYKWAEELAKDTVNHFKRGEYSFIKELDENNKNLKSVEINILKNNRRDISGELIHLDTEGIITINIYINFKDILREPQDMIKEITNVITHELSHSKIFWERFQNKQSLDDIPDYYEKIINVSRNENNSSDLYLFSRALYSTYYQELQSIISQSWIETKNNLDKYSTKDINSFKYSFQETNVYWQLIQNISICDKLKEKKNDRLELINILNENDINIDETEIIKIIDKIKTKSKISIKKAFDNACYYYLKEYGD